VAVTLHSMGWSFPGVLLAFGVSFVLVGWALPEAIVGPRRLARVAFALLPAASGVGGFALAALAWGPTWPSLLVGGLGAQRSAIACSGGCSPSWRTKTRPGGLAMLRRGVCAPARMTGSPPSATWRWRSSWLGCS
jgi:hypothetical protein